MALAAAAPLINGPTRDEPGFTMNYVVKDLAVVYAGALLSVDVATGHVRPFNSANNSDKLAGLALDTLIGDGTLLCRVACECNISIPLTGVAATNLGAAVYATADDTYVLTGDDNSMPAGYVIKYFGA